MDNGNSENEEKEKMQKEKEDATKYGEFVSSYFGWVSMEKQKDRAEELEDITKKEEKNRKS